jgi:hypothetical protein
MNIFMKTYKKLKEMKPEVFKRLVGVNLATFEAMVVECELHHKEKKSKGGKPNKLDVPTQLLLMLEYFREYRSMAHIGIAYDVSEATVSRIIRETESVLLKSGKFSLPSKKCLYEEDTLKLEYILIDATECPVERPKKNRINAIAEKRKHIRQRLK